MPQSIACVRICFFADLLFRFQRVTPFPTFSVAEKRRGLLLALSPSVKKFFSLFLEALNSSSPSKNSRKKKSPPPNHLQTAASTSQLFSFLKNRTAYCLQLPPRRLCSPSKAGRLLVASPFTVNSFFRLCAFFSTTRHRLPLSP